MSLSPSCIRYVWTSLYATVHARLKVPIVLDNNNPNFNINPNPNCNSNPTNIIITRYPSTITVFYTETTPFAEVNNLTANDVKFRRGN